MLHTLSRGLMSLLLGASLAASASSPGGENRCTRILLQGRPGAAVEVVNPHEGQPPAGNDNAWNEDDYFKIAHEMERNAELELKRKGWLPRRAKGFGILVAAMAIDAALTTKLNSTLPADYQFLSQFVSQVSILGFWALGAPIWEPLSSTSRKIAFRMKREHATPTTEDARDRQLDSQWLRTQENFSVNQQMSRNVIVQFIISAQENFAQARSALAARDTRYAADQLASAAYRLRTLFRDVAPDDANVAAEVRAMLQLKSFAIDRKAFSLEVWRCVQALDPDAAAAEREYARIFAAWELN